jgi:NADH-quinone oxidoreductase subunit M
MALAAIAGVVLGAMYMLWFAQRFLFGAIKAPHLPVTDLNFREKAILAILIIPVFWLGLAPGEALRKTELAARQYQQLIAGQTVPARTAAVPVLGVKR